MHAVQVVAVGYAISAAHQVGARRIAGFENFEAWLGDEPVPAEPEAQGLALDAEGQVRAAGPVAWRPSPQFVPIPIFWLWPRTTTNLLAFNAAVYLGIGSCHEEVRLRQAYGKRCVAYQRRGVPFYAPWPVRSASKPLLETKAPPEVPEQIQPTARAAT
jgi:hypothetical protein